MQSFEHEGLAFHTMLSIYKNEIKLDSPYTTFEFKKFLPKQ